MSSLPKRKGSFPIAAKWGAKLAVIFLGPFCLRSFSRKVFYHSVPSCRPLGIEVELELPCHVCCWAVNDLLAVFCFWGDVRCWYSHWMMLMTWLMGVFFFLGVIAAKFRKRLGDTKLLMVQKSKNDSRNAMLANRHYPVPVCEIMCVYADAFASYIRQNLHWKHSNSLPDRREEGDILHSCNL